jgi:hypothetical protein
MRSTAGLTSGAMLYAFDLLEFDGEDLPACAEMQKEKGRS